MAERSELHCKLYPFGTLAPLKYVVVCAFYQGRYMLSRHKRRDTWETQGGHIEPGESALDAAKRELFEESGVKDADISPVCDYLGFNAESYANGAVFLAEVHSLGTLPESEMKEIALFDTLPEKLTYPHVTPRLMEKALKIKEESLCRKF